MKSYHLQIVTPEGLIFDGQAESVMVRTIEGDVAILANHIDYLTAIGDGKAKVIANGEAKTAHCKGGVLAVTGDITRVVATEFSWE